MSSSSFKNDRKPRLGWASRPAVWHDVNRVRLQIQYSGHVQGVGFRYTAKAVAAGFDVVGMVRNLPDGRVELIAEGCRGELEEFQRAIREAGLGPLIRDEAVTWLEARGEFRGFEITR